MKTSKTYLTYEEVEQLADNIVGQLKKDDWIPSVVVGLTRGGLLPAVLLSHRLKIPMCSLDISLRDYSDHPFGGTTSTWIPEEINNGHKILVVDDINDTGATFEWIKSDWYRTVQLYRKPTNADTWPWNFIKFAALIHNQPSSQPSNYYGRTIDKNQDPSWIIFPWENQKNV
jgi:xanthine phosphoribosyltransferase